MRDSAGGAFELSQMLFERQHAALWPSCCVCAVAEIAHAACMDAMRVPQVEHTCTEEITGVDLVQCQLKIAAGATLEQCGLKNQAAVPPPSGFAVQCRVTCEDPTANFKPDVGRIEAYRVPGGPGIRLDGAVAAGNSISQYYDSLLTKVCPLHSVGLHRDTHPPALSAASGCYVQQLCAGCGGASLACWPPLLPCPHACCIWRVRRGALTACGYR
jgi:Biotin carboxylase C-terminal domain/Carbamoyl-phosphate synthase L chain, ATP binding domain